MEIPPSLGSPRPTLTVSKLKAYGAAGFSMEDGEEIAGCPRLYRQRYVEHNAVAKQDSPILFYGRAMHEALEYMEGGHSIDEALQHVFPQQLGPKEYARAREDLERYIERSEDASLATLATEHTLVATLMEEEQIDFGGIIDRIELDSDDLSVVHVRDFKAGWSVPKRADVEGSVQGMAYCWLVWNCWESLGLPERPSRVFFHLDSIRWRELVHEFTQTELDDFAEWTRAIGRRILADESAEPVLNPACHYCPIRHDCKAWRRLPGRGPTVLEEMTTQPLDKLLAWQAQAKETMKLLKAGSDDIDKILRSRVRAEGGSVDIGNEVYYENPHFDTEWDLRGILDDMGMNFVEEVAKVTKTNLEAALRRRGQRLRGHPLERYGERVPAGTRLAHSTKEETSA